MKMKNMITNPTHKQRAKQATRADPRPKPALHIVFAVAYNL